MWGRTKETVVLGWMRDVISREQREDETPEQYEAIKASVQKEIDRRSATPDLKVTLKHIGGPDDPTAFDQMVASEESARHKARVRARREIEADGVPHTPDAVSEAMGRDPEWHKALGASVKAWVVAGLVDGAKEYARLADVGERMYGAGGGGRVLLDAALEVKRFQTLTEDEGKS